jgi:transposase
MLRVRRDVVVRLALEPVDFRKSIDGLAIAVGHALGRDPMSGEVFVFCNRTRTALKALYWTPNGFVLVYKRLERLRFTGLADRSLKVDTFRSVRSRAKT